MSKKKNNNIKTLKEIYKENPYSKFSMYNDVIKRLDIGYNDLADGITLVVYLRDCDNLRITTRNNHLEVTINDFVETVFSGISKNGMELSRIDYFPCRLLFKIDTVCNKSVHPAYAIGNPIEDKFILLDGLRTSDEIRKFLWGSDDD